VRNGADAPLSSQAHGGCHRERSSASSAAISKIGLFLGAAHHRERRAHGVRLFKPPVLTLFDSANSDKVRVAFRRYQAGETGSKGVKGHWTGHLGPEGGSGTLTATYGHIQTAVPQFGYQNRKSDTRSRTLIFCESSLLRINQRHHGLRTRLWYTPPAAVKKPTEENARERGLGVGVF
jgi:hypothetical protein